MQIVRVSSLNSGLNGSRGDFQRSGISSSCALTAFPPVRQKTSAAVSNFRIFDFMILNTKLRFRITNISRIILSQYIKSLNLRECAIFE